MDWKGILEKGKIVLKESAIEYIDKCAEEEAEEARQYQKETDIYKAISAFVELKQTDSEIYNLLNNYFEISDISQAREYVGHVRVEPKIEELKKYCCSNGMSNADFVRFRKDCDIFNKLNSNRKLLGMSPEKLKTYLEKH